jgi:DNA-binding transcriptional MerR regulator
MNNIQKKQELLKDQINTYWPFNISNEPNFSIGEIKQRLEKEFSNISISKLRLLENNKLVLPKRASNGYRRYSLQDFIRIEFILTAQRDYFWPIDVIRKRLKQLDTGQVDASELIAGYNDKNIKISFQNQIMNNITVDDLHNLTLLSIEDIEDILIRMKKNIYDVRNNPKAYISFFKMWKSLKDNGLKNEHLYMVLRNISRNNDIFSLLKDKSTIILFQDTLLNLL